MSGRGYCWLVIIMQCSALMDYEWIRALILFQTMKAVDFLEDHSKSKLRSTGSTMFFRTVGRETRPAWGNRVIKDFYDLDYDVPSTSFRVEQGFKSSQSQQKRRIREDIEKSKQRRKGEQVNRSDILMEKKKVAEIRLKKKHSKRNPETIEVGALPNSKGKTLGLCPYEFGETTIQGRLQRRRNHHISFHKNKSSRTSNENPIFYDRHTDIDYSHSKLMQSRRTLAAFHPFASYSHRKVFEPRQELDKIFDTERARKATSPKRLKSAVRKFQTILERKQALLNQSARLTYETLPIALSLKKKALSYSITRSERETFFGPQVISPRRGCYR